jgi:hypothetical protein
VDQSDRDFRAGSGSIFSSVWAAIRSMRKSPDSRHPRLRAWPPSEWHNLMFCFESCAHPFNFFTYLSNPGVSCVLAHMFDRRDHPSVLTCLPRPSCFSVRLGRRFSVPACTLTESRAQQPSREARSRAEPRAAASLRRAWRARRALDLDDRCARRNA